MLSPQSIVAEYVLANEAGSVPPVKGNSSENEPSVRSASVATSGARPVAAWMFWAAIGWFARTSHVTAVLVEAIEYRIGLAVARRGSSSRQSRRPGAGRERHRWLERAVAAVQEHADGFIALIGGDQVELAVTIVIGRDDLVGHRRGWRTGRGR